VRRAVDVLVSLAALLILAPALAAIALLVKVDSPGPAIFRQVRVGLDGRRFTMLKFRTMVLADSAEVQMGPRADPRLTRVGGILRRTKLDELPQFVNVLRGDMTLVGPRAEVPEFVNFYTQAQRAVLSVRPGLTGPGQLEYARRFEAELDDAADPNATYVHSILPAKLVIDLDYIETRSAPGDVLILLKTIRHMAAALRGR
jgi:lipopolysaccharide/colanic/teichoic acid biosynthesis glycosyltransferase